MKKLTLALLVVMILTFSIVLLVSCGEEDQETPLAQVTVKFVVKDTVISEAVYTEGDSIQKPEMTEYGSYTITHWTVNGSSKYALFPYKVGQTDLTFTAYTTHNIKVEFYADGVKVKSETYENNALVNAPEAPAKDGYTFKEWVLDDTSITFPYNLSKITEDEIRFEAIYEKMYKVEFTSLGDVYSSKYYVYNSSMPMPVDPVVPGYTFIYWVDDDGNKIDYNAKVTSDLNFSAIFEKDLYTVNYYLGNSSTPYKTLYTSGKVLDLKYTGDSNFYGWYTNRNYTTKFDFSKNTTKDVSLYGKVYVDNLAIIRSQGTTQKIAIDSTQFESLNIANVTYTSNITLSVGTTSMIARYSFTHANGSSYKVTYDVLSGKISAVFNQAAGVDLTVEKYNYAEIDLSSYTSTNIYANAELNPKLEVIAMEVAQVSYEYIHNIYTRLHSEIVVGADADPDRTYDISATSPSRGIIDVSSSYTFYSIKVYNEFNECIYYTTNTKHIQLSNLDEGTYRIVVAYEQNFATYVLRQYISQNVNVL